MHKLDKPNVLLNIYDHSPQSMVVYRPWTIDHRLTKFLTMKYIYTTFLLLIFSLTTFAQVALNRPDVPFFVGTDKLDLALTGGLNNPQFSEVDLNNDGIQDLFIFDKTGDVVMTFLNGGTANEVDYTFAPEYVEGFPNFKKWVLLRDYNCDGIQDAFCYSQMPGVAGVTVYEGYYDNDKIAFTLAESLIRYPGFNQFPTNLYVSSEDYPSVHDLDNDGDLDILTFSISGGWIEYYENQSQEEGNGCADLDYELVDNCWGRFYESGVTNSLDLSPSPDSCINNPNFIGRSPADGVHIGSSLLNFDIDDDGDNEILLGDVSFTDMVLGINGGNADTAWMNDQIIGFPDYTTPVDIPIFPAAFYMDVNNDGSKDLLAAPNARNVSENYYCSWFYENTQSTTLPLFDYQQNDFLINEMVDYGSETAPAFFDHNGDGLLDIVIGTYGFFQAGGNYMATIALYENTGTTTLPEYTLVDDNYANLQATPDLRALNPSFGDFDDDGDLDMLLGEEFGKLLYFENTDTGNGLAVFPSFTAFQNIDVGQFSAPYPIDIDRDGLLDVVIGERNGNLNYWRNIGTAQVPDLVEEDNFFGNIDCRELGFTEGYCDPVIIDDNGEYVLYIGSEPGNIRRYINIEDSLAVGLGFEKADSLFGGIVQGARTRLDVADINDDGNLEYLVGNRRGGFTLYSAGDILISTTAPELPDFVFNIYPNPTTDELAISFAQPLTQSAELSIFSALGQQLYQSTITENTRVDVSQFARGIYFCRVQIGERVVVKKFVKS